MRQTQRGQYINENGILKNRFKLSKRNRKGKKEEQSAEVTHRKHINKMVLLIKINKSNHGNNYIKCKLSKTPM